MCKPEATESATRTMANDTYQKASLEELVRADPPAPFFQAASTAFRFVWKTKVCAKVSPGGWLALYGGMTGLWMGLPTQQRLLRRLVGIAGSLPLLGFVGVGILSTLFVRNKRQPASESAQAILLERLEKGRARRIPGAYDVYLPPPPPPDGAAPNTKQVGMLYFPGALINHTAYASVAAALSDEGILVVIVSLEPVRFIADVATNRSLALRALVDLETHHQDIAVDEWVLAGHSAGAMTALNLAAATASVHSSIRKLVVCGVGRNETGEGQASLRNKSLSVLVVNGSEDGLLKLVKQDEREAFDQFLPPPAADTDATSKTSDSTVGSTHSVIIPGGNHGGFADYPPSPIDGQRTILLQDQQRIFVERTADFLVGSK